MKDQSEDQKKNENCEENETPEVYSVDQVACSPTFSRRSFLQMAAIAAGTTALNSGCCGGCLTGPGQNKRYAPPLAHKSAVTALAVNASGDLLISGDKNGFLKLWQLPEGSLLQAWKGHDKPIADLAFPNIKKKVWSVDSSGILKSWGLPNGDEVSGPQDSPDLIIAFAVPLRGDWYAALTFPSTLSRFSKHLKVFNQTTGSIISTIEGLEKPALVLAASEDGRLLLAGCGNGDLVLWKEPGNVLVKTVNADQTAISALTIDPKGTMALSLSADGKLKSWNLPQLEGEGTYKSELGKLLCVSIRPGLDLFAAGSENGPIGLWELKKSDRKPKLLEGHAGAVHATAITPDGSLLISGGEDKTIRLWSLPEGKYLKNLIDLKINYNYVKGTSYKKEDVYGRIVTFTLPCGSPIPPGAVCTCNCVPGAMSIPRHHTQNYNSRGVCTCDLICTCNTVCTCQSVGRGGGGYTISYWYPN